MAEILAVLRVKSIRLGLATRWYEFLQRFGSRTYSQEGEDFILARYFGSKPDGFFVDVGAHHPHRFSNTYLLYKKGWRGVNIDATPGSMRKFARFRPRDTNVEAAVGRVAGSATYYLFNEPALNTFDKELVAQRQFPPWKVLEEVTLPVLPLAGILEKAVPAGQKIDLMTVDVEGRDLDVLQSNDWVRFRPKVVLVETLNRQLADLKAEPIIVFLESLGYAVWAKTFNTTFLIDASDM
jgi:FkbM family methyltransferase